MLTDPGAQNRDGRILFVDDDQRILDGIRRRLRGSFDIETAVGPERGLEAMAGDEQFAIVVADMNMPGMTGAQFLSIVRDRHPKSVRMMLTGNADVDTATAAVNDGNVFRYMTKPVTSEELRRSLDAGFEHRRVIDAMQRAEVAEQASLAKSQFLATVSHELRTPLTVIQSSAELLEQFGDEEPAEVRAEFLATISKYSCSLEGMIDQLLFVAELDASEGLSTATGSFELIAVLEQTIRDFAPEDANAHPATLVGPQSPVACRGDAVAMQRAITAILSNAYRYSPSDQPVRIEVAHSGETATVAIIDRGPGIPEAIADRVFEPFVQCSNVLVDKPPGLGLGLTIAQRILSAHGGTIACQEEPAGGTRVVFTLPLAQSHRVES
tara:strand:+ start:999 stop:2144 length:1146 start_codon:yes stop_codon:yes gene_type:complete